MQEFASTTWGHLPLVIKQAWMWYIHKSLVLSYHLAQAYGGWPGQWPDAGIALVTRCGPFFFCP